MKNKTDSSKSRKAWKIAAVAGLILVLTPLIAGAFSLLGYKIWAKDIELDKSLLPTASAMPVFYDADGNKIDYTQDGYIAPQDIPNDLKRAFIGLEDKRFYSHKGYDVKRMIGASLNNIKAGRVVEGASTITQQLVKNTHLSQERTFKRKIKEIAIAEKLEKEYSKDEILAMYLSVSYFGSGAYGVNAASRIYFGKTPAELTLSECALLAGIVKNPARYSPKNNPEKSIERRNTVLDILKKENYITKDECDMAKREKIEIVSQINKSEANRFYIERAMEEVAAALNITSYQLCNSGLHIFTNLNQNLQKELSRQSKNKANFESDNIDNAAVVIENESGKVLAHYSTLPYAVRRQAGSTLKPIAVYAPAVDKGLVSLGTPVKDEQIDFNGYKPENFGGIYYGDTNPREAIKKSMNSVAVKLMSYVGTETAAEYLARFGVQIADGDKNLALSLGATEKGVRPLQLAAAYCSLARGGEYVGASYVNFVFDGESKLINHETRTDGRQVVSRETADLITSALCDTVKDGTARGLRVLPFGVAAKTGTAENKNGKNSDAWNVGYTANHTVLVWHGAEEMSEKGGGYPTRHAAQVWKRLYENSAPDDFDFSRNIVEAEIDTYSTEKNKKVTLATDKTPAEYRRKELFALSNLPDCEGSCFETVKDPKFDIIKRGNCVTISFDTEEIYNYEIIRSDALGEKTVALVWGKDAVKKDNGYIEITDCPLSLGTSVAYTLICKLSSDENVNAFSTKSVYMDSFWDN